MNKEECDRLLKKLEIELKIKGFTKSTIKTYVMSNKGLLEFMYGSGLRVSECVNFKVRDLNLDNCTAKVQSGKGNKQRMIILSKDFVSKVRGYLVFRDVQSD